MIISRDRWICIFCSSQSNAGCQVKTVTCGWNSIMWMFDWCFAFEQNSDPFATLVPAFSILSVGQVSKGSSLATKCTKFEFRAWETSFSLLNAVMCLIVLLLVRSSDMKFSVVETENWNSKWLIPDGFPHGWSIPSHGPEKKSTYRVVFSNWAYGLATVFLIFDSY